MSGTNMYCDAQGRYYSANSPTHTSDQQCLNPHPATLTVLNAQAAPVDHATLKVAVCAAKTTSSSKVNFFGSIAAALIAFSLFFSEAKAIEVDPLQGTTTVASAITIAAGGTSQTLFTQNPNRKNCIITNSATDTLYIAFGTTAPTTTGVGFPIPTNQTFYCNGGIVVITDQINIIGATTGDKFYAVEISDVGH